MVATTDDRVSVRTGLRPGDLGRVTALHGELYAAEYGFNHVFEAYVAQTLAEFALAARPERNRLWVAERAPAGDIVGTIGIVRRDDDIAQLRWLLVTPAGRGRGLGRRLIAEALDFCRATGCRAVYLWTVSALTTAAKLYAEAGFHKTEALPPGDWGVPVVEERYDLTL